MNELVQVTEEKINGIDMIQAVDARELHTFLGVGRDFTSWMKVLIEKYDFEEEMDFSPKRGKSIGGRPSIEYAISLNMAKEIGMLAKSAKGKEIRKYFIECERKLQQQQPLLGSPEHLLQITTAYCKAQQQLQLMDVELKHKDVVIEQQTPIVEEYTNVINNTTSTLTATDVSAIFGTTPQKLNKLLIDAKIQRRVNQGTYHYYKLYAHYEGYYYTDTKSIPLPNGQIKLQLNWTQKGVQMIREQFFNQYEPGEHKKLSGVTELTQINNNKTKPYKLCDIELL